MAYDIRLGSTLSFDEDKEKDIIAFIEGLTERHKLGEFISYLIRECYDNPNLSRATWEKMSKVGVTAERNKFFTSVSREVDTLKNRVDEMYEMNLKLVALAQFGKRMGLTERTENMLQANFLIQNQLNQLCAVFGVASLSHVFASNRTDDAYTRADDTLAFILESYDNIIEELQASLTTQAVRVEPARGQTEHKAVIQKASHPKGEQTTALEAGKIDMSGLKPDLSDTSVDMLNKAEGEEAIVIDTSAIEAFMGML